MLGTVLMTEDRRKSKVDKVPSWKTVSHETWCTGNAHDIMIQTGNKKKHYCYNVQCFIFRFIIIKYYFLKKSKRFPISIKSQIWFLKNNYSRPYPVSGEARPILRGSNNAQVLLSLGPVNADFINMSQGIPGPLSWELRGLSSSWDIMRFKTNFHVFRVPFPSYKMKVLDIDDPLQS